MGILDNARPDAHGIAKSLDDDMRKDVKCIIYNFPSDPTFAFATQGHFGH
jgi:hypothetical protein